MEECEICKLLHKQALCPQCPSRFQEAYTGALSWGRNDVTMSLCPHKSHTRLCRYREIVDILFGLECQELLLRKISNDAV